MTTPLNFITLLTQFLIYGLVNVIIFEVGHFCVSIVTLETCIRDDGWYLWVGEIHRCLNNDGWMADIAVGHAKVLLQILHVTRKVF